MTAEKIALYEKIIVVLKSIAAVCISILLIGFISAIFINKNYVVERQVEINIPNDSVFNYIKFLKNQQNYSKWAKLDPSMNKTFTGVDGTVGFVSAWDSKVKAAGQGEQKIVKLIEGQRVDYKLSFEKPQKDTATAYMATTLISNNKTMVKWGIAGRLKYPFNIMSLFMDKMIGPDLEVGLVNLKTLLEK